MSRTIIVGDIHGMLSEIRDLIQATGLTKEDTLVLVGDLVDKGPDSPGVVRFLRGLREEGFSVVLVLGNHEEKHCRYRLARAKAPTGQAIKMKGVEEMEAITSALSPEDVAFLDSAVLFHRIPEHNAVVVHGGILPVTRDLDEHDKAMRGKILRVRHVTGVAHTKLTVEFDFPFEVDPAAVAEALRDAAWSEFAMVRSVVRPVGEFVSLGEETDADPFWADVYDGRFGHVYFGHSPFTLCQEPVRFPHATGLDLGAVYGNYLAAVILEPGYRDVTVTIRAAGKFATSFSED